MSCWTWVNDLFSQDHKKKTYWDARCIYMLCPSNWPVQKKVRLQIVQKLSMFVYQYRCRDCGCLLNLSVEQPEEDTMWARNLNPALHGGQPNWKFHV